MKALPLPVGAGDHIVQAGDSILSIAARSGHLPDTIWNDSANVTLKEVRKDPEVLLPGDRVTVMPLRPKQAARATGQRWVFQRKGLAAKFTLIVQDEEGTAFASKKYELVIDGNKASGTTDADGKIECAIAPRARTGTLTLWLDEPGHPNPWVREISLASLYPIEHPVGVQQRLANLGYYSGALDGRSDAETAAAIAAFQKAQGLHSTGTIDDTLRQKLVAAHKI
jgi:hypothetical protein